MRMRWRTVGGIVAAVVITAGGVVAVANGDGRGGDSSTSKRTASASDAGGASSVADGAAAPARAGTAESGSTDLGGLPVPALSAHVIKQASLELEVGRRAGPSTVRAVIAATGTAHGFVESTDLSDGRSELTVRVPADAFDVTLGRVLALGRRRDLSVHGRDVTGAVADLEARLRNLRAQEAVLLGLMGRATTIADSIAVQQQLSQNQEQIEQLDGQRRTLADQTTYATLTVSIVARGAPAAASESPTGLSSAWADGVDAALAVTGGTLTVLGALLPLLVLAGVGVLGWRLAARRRRAKSVAPAA